jgi:hypothetical protein
MPYVVRARLRILAEQITRGHDHPWRAVPALQGVALVERLLQGMPLPVRGEPLDRGHFAPVGLDRQHGAALDGLAVQVDRAGPAVGGVAANRGAGQTQPVTQIVDQQKTGFHLVLVRRAVHLHRDTGHVPSQGTVRGKSATGRDGRHSRTVSGEGRVPRQALLSVNPLLAYAGVWWTEKDQPLGTVDRNQGAAMRAPFMSTQEGIPLTSKDMTSGAHAEPGNSGARRRR